MLKLTNKGHHMKKLNQKGFSHFEIALLILVITALGFAGYTVWQKNKAETPPVSEVPVSNKTTDNPKVGVAEFSEHKSIGIAFKYPSEWAPSDDFKDKNEATDPAWDESTSFKGLNSNNVNTTQMQFMVKPATNSYEQALTTAKADKHTKDVTPLEVDSIKGYSKTVNYEGESHYITLFYNGKEYNFQGVEIDMQQLLDIVKTVKRI
jgi:hypothetical protein